MSLKRSHRAWRPSVKHPDSCPKGHPLLIDFPPHLVENRGPIKIVPASVVGTFRAWCPTCLREYPFTKTEDTELVLEGERRPLPWDNEEHPEQTTTDEGALAFRKLCDAAAEGQASAENLQDFLIAGKDDILDGHTGSVAQSGHRKMK